MSVREEFERAYDGVVLNMSSWDIALWSARWMASYINKNVYDVTEILKELEGK